MILDSIVTDHTTSLSNSQFHMMSSILSLLTVQSLNTFHNPMKSSRRFQLKWECQCKYSTLQFSCSIVQKLFCHLEHDLQAFVVWKSQRLFMMNFISTFSFFSFIQATTLPRWSYQVSFEEISLINQKTYFNFLFNQTRSSASPCSTTIHRLQTSSSSSSSVRHFRKLTKFCWVLMKTFTIICI